MQSLPSKVLAVLIVLAVILYILGLLAGPLIRASVPPEQLVDNFLLNAIPSILKFLSILLAFVSVMVVVSIMLNHKVPPRIYESINLILIAGIVLGVVGIFQPWVFQGFKYGLMLLLVSWLLFMVWSYISPRSEEFEQEERAAGISEGPPDNLQESRGN